MRSRLASLLIPATAVGEVFFVPSARLGAIAVLLLAFHPGLLVCGLVATIAALSYGRLTDPRAVRLWGAAYLFNPALVGLAVGCFFRVEASTLLLTAIFGVVTYAMTCVFAAGCFTRGLPVLSAPFCLAAITALAASGSYPHLVATELRSPLLVVPGTDLLPPAMQRFFVAFGNILFMPDVPTGAVLFAGLLIYSRILGLLAVLGYAVGSLVETALQAQGAALSPYVWSFNNCLTAMALGGVFTVPSQLSLIVATVAVAATVGLAHALIGVLGPFGIPVFALPFNLVTLAFLHGLRHVGYRGLPVVVGGSPEQTLSTHAFEAKANPQWDAVVQLPFSGLWCVYQKVDDRWTHRGPWRHALDFVRVDTDGATHEADGTRLEHYYAYREPVRAPVSGHIVALENRLPDNAIGDTDRIRNWGNYLIIRSRMGFHVEISHLAQDSITPRIGQFVNAGDPIAACGNTGLSPQPHIHLQVQRGPYLGEATVPFCFGNFVTDRNLFINQLPTRNQRVESLSPNLGLHRLLDFAPDQRLDFVVERAGIARHCLRLNVNMDADTGEFYLGDENGSRLFFFKSGDLLIFQRFGGAPDSPLRVLQAAAPVIPLTFGQPLEWQTVLPLDMQFSRWHREAINLTSLFCSEPPQRWCHYRNDASGTEIRGEVFWQNRYQPTLCRIDPRFGLVEVACGNLVLRRME